MASSFLAYLRRHHVALLALGIALSGSAYAATRSGDPNKAAATAGKLDSGARALGAEDVGARVLAVPGLGRVELYACTDATHTVSLAFRNTRAAGKDEFFVYKHGDSQPNWGVRGPGETLVVSSSGEQRLGAVIQVHPRNSEVPFATITVFGIEFIGDECRVQAQAVVEDD